MSKIRGKNTGPELIVRSLLHAMGFRFRIHVKKLPGQPDVVLARHRKIILVHGCFWHAHPGCKRATRPTTRAEFWSRKIDGNVKRDEAVRIALRELGWNVLVVWQCETLRPEVLRLKLLSFMERHDGAGLSQTPQGSAPKALR